MATPDRIDFIQGGSTYNVATDLVEELLANEGMSLHSAVPLQLIDKVGFLKTGIEAKEIVADLLAKYMQTAGPVDTVTNSNWPFPVSGTDSQAMLDFGDDDDACNNGVVVDIDLGSIYCDPNITGVLPGGKSIQWPTDLKWSVSLDPNHLIKSDETFTVTFTYGDEFEPSQYGLAMNADRE